MGRERDRDYDDRVSGRARRSRINPVFLALGGLLAVLALVWLFTSNRNPDQDKLTGSETSATRAAQADPEKLCAKSTTYDAIKRDLFRRAAQLRGSDQAAFDKLSAYASLRMENPVMEGNDESRGVVNCAGSLSLDLPPGVAVVGGRRTLTSDIDYTVQPAADGSGTVVLLRNGDSIITPLATLARVGQAQPTSVDQPTEGGTPIPPATTVPVETPHQIAPAPQPSPLRIAPRPEAARPTSTARPSFNCANARTRGELAVCSDSGLASLDRQMAGQFYRAMSQADPGQRVQLERTRNRFLAYRDRCGSDACIADAYRGRMREISDIMNR